MEKTNKDKWIKVRINPIQREYWHSKAAESGRTLSDLIRESLERVRSWTPENKDVENERLRHLAKIGANLNQIAKWANTYKSAAESAEVISHLISIEEEIIKKKNILFPTAQSADTKTIYDD